MNESKVEAGRRGASAMWKKRRARDAVTAAKLALWDEITDAVKLLAHPKFTTDQGRIHYYVTKSDVEFARNVLGQIEAAANSVPKDSEGEGENHG